MLDLLITWLVTAMSFLIISKLPIGVEIDKFEKVFICATVFGVLNALLKPILTLLTLPFIVSTWGLFFFILNTIIFCLAAYLVEGFRLKTGIWSAFLGSICLSLVNSVLLKLLSSIA